MNFWGTNAIIVELVHVEFFCFLVYIGYLQSVFNVKMNVKLVSGGSQCHYLTRKFKQEQVNAKDIIHTLFVVFYGG